MTCNICEDIAKEYNKALTDMLSSNKWIVESVECDNEIDGFTHKVVKRYLTIRMTSR